MFKGAVCVALIFAVLTEVSTYSYSDQDAWGESCSGVLQSPIDIISADAVKRNLKSFEFTNYNTTREVKISNDFLTANVYWGGPNPVLSGAGLQGTYELFLTIFHLGKPSDNKGSEHLVDGHQSALEMQLYHWNTAYDRGQEAYQNRDAIAALSILYDVGPKNEALEPLIAQFSNILDHGSSHEITDESIPALSSFLPSDTSKFYRYYGSFTAPTCWEALIWTVFADRQTVSIEQLDEFRKLKDNTGSPNLSNFRNVQNSPAIMVTYSDGKDKKKVCGFCIWIKLGTWCAYV